MRRQLVLGLALALGSACSPPRRPRPPEATATICHAPMATRITGRERTATITARGSMELTSAGGGAGEAADGAIARSGAQLH